jgi:hypothetical protein
MQQQTTKKLELKLVKIITKYGNETFDTRSNNKIRHTYRNYLMCAIQISDVNDITFLNFEDRKSNIDRVESLNAVS